jgi:hypothetical protein
VAADWLWALRAVIHINSTTPPSPSGPASPSVGSPTSAAAAGALVPEYGDLALLTYLGGGLSLPGVYLPVLGGLSGLLDVVVSLGVLSGVPGCTKLSPGCPSGLPECT